MVPTTAPPTDVRTKKTEEDYKNQIGFYSLHALGFYNLHALVFIVSMAWFLLSSFRLWTKIFE